MSAFSQRFNTANPKAYTCVAVLSPLTGADDGAATTRDATQYAQHDQCSTGVEAGS